MVWGTRAVEVCVRKAVAVAGLGSSCTSKTGMFPLRQIFHELQPLVLFVDVDLLVEQLGRVLVFLFVNSFALSVKTFLVLPLLIIDILLKASMHLEGRVEPIFYRVVGPARHMLGNERPFFAVLQEQAHQLLVFIEGPFIPSNIGIKMVMPSLSALFSNPAR